MSKDTVTKEELMDMDTEETGLPTEEVLGDPEKEYDYISGFMKAASYKEDENLTKKIEIRRKGELLFDFKIHPISESEIRTARKRATKYMPNPANKKLPPIEKEVNTPLANAMLIYLSTVAEDKAKLWDNQVLKDKFNAIEGHELVSVALLPGEIDGVLEVINEVNGYNIDFTEYSGN